MSDTVRTHHRVRASELVGRNWLNTGGKSLDLDALRGKIVLTHGVSQSAVMPPAHTRRSPLVRLAADDFNQA